jgi:methyltransferase (TIGR00027 family)
MPSSPLDFQLSAPDEPVLASARLSAVARSRYAEDRLRTSGLRQHIVLGAGLDTSAHRAPGGVRTWLVDLPDVCAWRTSLFRRAGVQDAGVPVAVQLGADPLVPALAEAGVELDQPAQVSCLGVVMYLGLEDLAAVLADLRALRAGSSLVTDHVLPPRDRDAAGRSYAAALSGMAGGVGEPWLSTATPEHWAGVLGDAGWDVVESCPEASTLALRSHPLLRPQRLVQLTRAVRREQE